MILHGSLHTFVPDFVRYAYSILPVDCRLFVFGSRADGTARERSDIDIGIECPSGKMDYRLVMALQEFAEKYPTLYKVDIVDFATVSDQFREVAMQHVEYLEKPSLG
jgi:predicted nucleotidyltransferase